MDIDLKETLKNKHFLNKYVCIKTIDGNYHKGLMKCLDPLSGDIILVNSNHSIFVTGQSCKNVNEIENEIKATELLLLKTTHRISDEDLAELKERLVAWIKKHRLPVQENEDGSLFVCESVTIKPPYQAEDCVSDNARVLLKASELINSLPPKSVEDQITIASEEIVTSAP